MAPPGLVYFVTGGLYLLTPSTHFAHTRNFILNNFLLWKVSHTRVTELHEEAPMCRHPQAPGIVAMLPFLILHSFPHPTSPQL